MARHKQQVRQVGAFNGSYAMYQGPPVGGIQTGGLQVAGKGLFGGFFKKLGKAGRGGDVETLKKRVDKFRQKLANAKAELAEAESKAEGSSDESEAESKSEGMVIGRMW
jgi:hypothetical protein